ncbi:MAG TPA: hypothetical protein VGR62_04285 [Candidatus Binatia bacterium]|nr:hypothetical protein [Candidatus Binatia bacterium]
MESKILEDRRKSLEEEFFRKENERQREALRQRQDRTDRKDGLRIAGITDETLAEQLIDLGVGAEEVVALGLIPLIAVAWADGSVDDTEREALLRGAREAGVRDGGPGEALLKSWLATRPPASLVDTWSAYVRELCATMAPEAKREFRDELLNRTQEVARAAGGFLGIATVSPAEKAVIERLSQAFCAD